MSYPPCEALNTHTVTSVQQITHSMMFAAGSDSSLQSKLYLNMMKMTMGGDKIFSPSFL